MRSMRITTNLTVADIEAALQATDSDWGRDTLRALGDQSPLMLHVTLEQIRRARGMTLAEELRMERDLVHHCFYLRPVEQSETVEGVRALAIDKDQQPQWQPARIQDVDAAEVAAFFVSPWSAAEHPLASLS